MSIPAYQSPTQSPTVAYFNPFISLSLAITLSVVCVARSVELNPGAKDKIRVRERRHEKSHPGAGNHATRLLPVLFPFCKNLIEIIKLFCSLHI